MADLGLVTFPFWACFSTCKKGIKLENHPLVSGIWYQALSDFGLRTLLLWNAFPLQLMSSD